MIKTNDYKNKIQWTFVVLLVCQLTGQLFPPFSIFFGTPLIIPLTTLLICFYSKNNSTDYKFESKSLIVILAFLISAVLDYFFAPGTHDQVGFGWMSLLWALGLYILFFGLVVAKFCNDFCLRKMGFNIYTAFNIKEILIFILIPLVYNKLLWDGKIEFFFININ